MLRLRPYKKCDAKTIVSWISDEEMFRKWCADRYPQYPIDEDDMNHFYEDMAYDENFYPMTAFDESGVIGHFMLKITDQEKQHGYIGFVIVDSNKRGKGYGRDMIRMAVQYAFDFLKLKQVGLSVFDSNPGAYYCYKSAGFREPRDSDKGLFHVLDQDWKRIEMVIDRA